jgi:hypothetical protein
MSQDCELSSESSRIKPNEADAKREIDAVLQGFESAGADRGVYYLSTSITTGRRELELLSRLDCRTRAELRARYHDAWTNEVLHPNERDALLQADLFAETVALGLLVINPARIKFEHWTQDHYDLLWSELIRRFPLTIVATPGWQYSRGARLEIQLAIDLGVAVVDIAGAVQDEDSLVASSNTADAEIESRKWHFEDVTLPKLLPNAENDGRRSTQHVVEPPESHARQVFVWLARERNYQVSKFGTTRDDEHTLQHGLSPDAWWTTQLEMYYHRARVLGLEHENGRQALAKYVATGCGMLESVVRSYGRLPNPGVPSGEIS